MGVEIERRYLVSDPNAALSASSTSCHITQGYFGVIDRLRVRVRIRSMNSHSGAFLTFKGARRGLCRLEFEYPLDLDRAQAALGTLPSNQIISKNRFEFHGCQGAIWTIDQFLGLNTGLVLAEIELSHPNQKIELPEWVGDEVTFNPRYGNSRLARSPIKRVPLAA